VIFYLIRRGRSVKFAVIPAVMMVILPAVALNWNIFPEGGWLAQENWLLVGFGALTLSLQAWMVIECLILVPRVKGVLEEALPPLSRPATVSASTAVATEGAGGPNC